MHFLIVSKVVETLAVPMLQNTPFLKYDQSCVCTNTNHLTWAICLSVSAVEGEGQGRILQRFPEKDWEDSPFPQGVELVSLMFLCKLEAKVEHTRYFYLMIHTCTVITEDKKATFVLLRYKNTVLIIFKRTKSDYYHNPCRSLN